MKRIGIRVLDIDVAIDVPNAVVEELIGELARRVSFTHVPGDSAPHEAGLGYELRPTVTGYDVVRLEGERCELIDRAPSLAEAASLMADNLHPWVAEQHRELLIVHAGVVAWNDTAIVIPGRSYSGKSTLVKALLRAGATYLSDEFAPIDRHGAVHPYPRDLSIRGSNNTVTLVPPADLNATVAPAPVPLSLIIDTAYEAGATFVPTPTQGAAAMLAVIDNTLVARSRPEHTMDIVAAITTSAVVWRCARGDADETARIILQAASQ